MHNLFLVFVNLYMFGGYLCPLSGSTNVCVQHLVLIILTHFYDMWTHSRNLKQFYFQNNKYHLLFYKLITY